MTKTVCVELTEPQIKALLQVCDPDIEGLVAGTAPRINSVAFKNAVVELQRAERKVQFSE